MASPLERLPTELRHAILSLAIWTPTPPPDFSRCPVPDRVRLQDGLAVWVEATPRPPAALSLLLTSRTLHRDVRLLVSSGGITAPYELDIAFIHECGLFPTWTVCPLPSQIHISTLRASIRILSAKEIDFTRVCPDARPVPCGERFMQRFPGDPSPFGSSQPSGHQPPPGACNFYHLLTRFLALGPLGVARADPGPDSPNPPPTRRRYTLNSLIIATTLKRETIIDRRTPRTLELPYFPTVPFGFHGSQPLVFPAPPAADFPEYVWSGRGTPNTAYGLSPYGGDRLALYLTLAVWNLLDLAAPLARAYGRRLYEGVLGTVEFWVDGEKMERPVYDTERLLALLLPPAPAPTTTAQAAVAPAGDYDSGAGGRDDGPPEMAEGLEAWRQWVAALQPGWVVAGDGSFKPVAPWWPLYMPRPAPPPPPPTLRPENVPRAMAERLEAWRRWVVEWRRGRREEVAKGQVWRT